ncbi:archaemetzincin-2-like [Mya arenaria]|uniref:archaemetzincin-2-like n=1 Tax=Mya arenaria TaxID=6604 RepID=UPI0022E2259D|nr:archaemetzincin-2-like [Mya arenaria]
MPKQPRTSTNKGRGSPKNTDVQAEVPWASGFKPPSATVARNAIGYGKQIPDEFDPDLVNKDGSRFFQTIPIPCCVDDWLSQYNEEGQTYKQFLSDCPWFSTRKRKYMSQEFLPSGLTIKEKYPEGKIYIVPVGDFDEDSLVLLDKMLKYTELFLGLPVVSLSKIKLEVNSGQVFWMEQPDNTQTSNRRSSNRSKKHQLSSRYNKETDHLQVCVDSNLMQLRKVLPRDAICMIGLTMLDLYGEDSDLFVAGMAAGNQRVAIFSLYRYDPCLTFSKENWFQIERDSEATEDERHRIMLQRGCKLLVHEICHLLGVDHCIFYDCCMNGSGHLQEDFRQPMHLCPVDLHKLHTLVGFSVVERYRALQVFYSEHGLTEEERWIKQRITAICESSGEQT